LKITINDVAKLAGVSKATVSRVINNPETVSENLRSKILEVIDTTNYRPSKVAQALSNKRTNIIGIIIPDFTNPVFSKIIVGIEDVFKETEYDFLMTSTNFAVKTEIKQIKMFDEKNVDGLVILTDQINDELRAVLENFTKPIIIIGSDAGLEKIPVVKIDNYRAAFEVVSYLLNLGHEKIVMITGDMKDKFSGELRFDGYVSALKRKGLKVQREFVYSSKYSSKDGYKAMTKILTRTVVPTAVFCVNDKVAIGVLKCCHDNQILVPEDISVVGFDDIEIASLYNPTLSTVSQPFMEKGRAAAENMLKMINGKEVQREIVLDHELIIRQTTAKIKRKK